jgi:tagatose 1,6-diphosphate aldolase
MSQNATTLRITPGKQQGLKALADARGVIAALAIDQRDALRTLLGGAMNTAPESVPAEILVQFKEAVSSILTPHASSILLDPEYGLRAAQRRAKTAGLLLAYEQSGYDKQATGRLPRLLEHWSAQRLVEAGANGVKLLLYYSNGSPEKVNSAKQAFVERVGAECAAGDVPFFLELVSYREGMDEKGAEFAKMKPAVVTAGVAEFSQSRYRVDVLKVGIPVNLNFVEGAPSAFGDALYSRAVAKDHIQQAAAASRVPFIYLSEGVSNASFQFGLELAAETGVKFSGVLCGRATWKNGVPIFVSGGMSALQDWLGQEGVRNISNINECLAGATPWFKYIGSASGD